MLTIKIEWRHFEKDKKTCQRCAKTGVNLVKAIRKLEEELKNEKVKIFFKEIKLQEEKMAESNLILIDDVPLENFLKGATPDKNYCPSCQEILGKNYQCFCRTVKTKNRIYEAIPFSLIKRAILKRIKEKKEEK